MPIDSSSVCLNIYFYVEVCETILHEGYDDFTTENDISILRLCDFITFNKNVTPVCLPASKEEYYDNVTVAIVHQTCKRCLTAVSDC